MLCARVEVHMTTQLIQFLARLCARVCVETTLVALLHQLKASGCGQPEQATALASA